MTYQMFAPTGGRLLLMGNLVEQPDELSTAPHPVGGRLVRAAMGTLSSRGASQKMASRGYTLNHSTINNMRNGQAVESDSVIKFALAFQMDLDQLLEAFGHHTTARDIKANEAASIQHILDPDEEEMLRFYRGLPPELRSPIKDSMRGFVTAKDLMNKREKARSIGRRVDDDETGENQETGSDEE